MITCHMSTTTGQAADGDVYAHLRRIGRFHETKRTDVSVHVSAIDAEERDVEPRARYQVCLRCGLRRQCVYL